ncbi:U3 small nucleolar RNA-associated protein 25 homolog [Zingiber officinale]|uniref:U3 small nucleolar RNA-associated protein 25 homolog n=1 Tax=Zingiber officinale TaxID=94328 RepID=UPI001C4D6DD8|nr:U3 small nucleolar RNA-associated protein 25 homolog [Zingiber officinale]
MLKTVAQKKGFKRQKVPEKCNIEKKLRTSDPLYSTNNEPNLGAAEGNDACDATLVNHNCTNEYKYEGRTCDLQDSQILEREPAIDDEPTSTSSFQRHVGLNLTSEEVEQLQQKQWKFKWEIPVRDKPMSKCVGTGDPILPEAANDLVKGLNQKLHNHWISICKTSGPNIFSSPMQGFFFSLCNTYRDILHCNKQPFYLKGNEEDSSIMDAYIMHALNHIYQTRDVIIKNDAQLTKHEEEKMKEILCGDTYLDQGFTRPKVLLLLPLGSIALRVVKRIIELTPISNQANAEHVDRFTEEFGAGDEEEDEEEEASLKSKRTAKPEDFKALFGGNNNDHFLLGIKFTKRSIKLYSDFYSSDIIVASPLGLITKIGEAEAEKEKDVDYLSSIEVLIVDHADVILMQNWSHLNTVVEQLNRTPSKQHGTDIMRIRPWYLDGSACFYRQTILLSSFLNPDINALFSRLCLNYEGKVKLISEYEGVLPKILLPVRQVYERFDAKSLVDADDARLEYFCKKVFPKLKDSIEGGTMLFINSYFEFVRIRNFLKAQNASFCLLAEYTKISDISRARLWFFEGKRKIMLYTERAHFYNRFKIRGVQNMIIYSLPERKELYPELINMLNDSKDMICNILFSRFDKLKLERIVGTAAANRLLSSDKSIFIFC